MEILLTKISDVDENQCRPLIRYLSPERQGRIPRYKKSEDRLRAFLGEMLVSVFAIERWGLSANDMVFSTTEYQKPYLTNHPKRHFNVSHSGEWVACAFHETSIGLDIEQIRPMDMSIADRFFSQQEVEHLRRQSPEERLSCFFRLWTLRESYIKAVGGGLTIPLDSFSFDLTHETMGFRSSIDREDWSFCCYSIHPDYAMASCSRGVNAEFPEQAQVISGQDLLKRYERVACVRPDS